MTARVRSLAGLLSPGYAPRCGAVAAGRGHIDSHRACAGGGNRRQCAIFTLLKTALLDPLLYPDSDRLARDASGSGGGPALRVVSRV
jgi:hypothetical protein